MTAMPDSTRRSACLSLLSLGLLVVGCTQAESGTSVVAPTEPAPAVVTAEVQPLPPAAEPSAPVEPTAVSASEPAAAPVVKSELRTPNPERLKTVGGVKEITFDTVKFDMKSKEDPFTREMLTEQIEALAGQKVRVRGYILPGFQQRGLTQFVLMRDNMECCFGPGAWVYDCMIVDMKPGKSADFTTRPIAVEGTFSIQEVADADGVVRAIYHLDGENAK